MIVRLLLAALVVLAVVLLLRRARAAVDRARTPPAITGKTARCAHCGVYFPRAEGVRSDGQDYCSQEHAGGDDAT